MEKKFSGKIWARRALRKKNVKLLRSEGFFAVSVEYGARRKEKE